MMTPLKLLLVEDSQNDADLLINSLKKGGFDVDFERVDTAEIMKQKLVQRHWDLIISDFSMPNFTGLEALSILRETDTDIPFILSSGTVGEDIAVNAMKAGASDYLLKDNFTRLVPAVKRELREAQTRKKLKEQEEQLRQSQKMEVIGKLAGGVAHDFNNILAVNLLYCDMLLGKIPKDDPMYEDVEQIKKSGERASNLTRQLLAFSRKQVLEPRVLDLNQVISGMVKMLQTLIGEHIELTTILDHNLARVRVDPGQIEQVVMNLAVNSRDAMPKGGSITINTANTELTEDSPLISPSLMVGKYVIMTITDTGSGMDEQTKGRIFEPFFTTKDPNKGTGLGLSTVYGIIIQSKGFISVESKLRMGTTFKIYLPQVDLPPEPMNNRATKSSDRKIEKGTILLIEDDANLRTVLSKCLENSGYTVMKTLSPEETGSAIAKYGGKIDLLVTDVVMPHMSGPELATLLRSVQHDAKVLFISGYLDNALDAFNALKGDSFFLQKPFSADTLLNKIQSIMSGND